MSIDTAHFQEELEQVRERLNRTIEHHDIGNASLEEETGELLSAADNHLADAATDQLEEPIALRLCHENRGPSGVPRHLPVVVGPVDRHPGLHLVERLPERAIELFVAQAVAQIH